MSIARSSTQIRSPAGACIKTTLLPVKQVLIINEALQLPCGKLAAQAAHAAIGAFLAATHDAQVEWLTSGMTKIVLGCDSADALMTLHEQAERAGIPAFLVHDAGRTLIPAGTLTCLGLGPAENQLLAPITGDLRLHP